MGSGRFPAVQVVVLVDAAPGFEGSVEASLRRVNGVTSVIRHKQGNFDLAVLVEVSDPALLERLLTNELRTISGVRGLERVGEPDAALLQRFPAK